METLLRFKGRPDTNHGYSKSQRFISVERSYESFAHTRKRRAQFRTLAQLLSMKSSMKDFPRSTKPSPAEDPAGVRTLLEKLTRLRLVDAACANAEASRLDDCLLKLVVQQPAA